MFAQPAGDDLPYADVGNLLKWHRKARQACEHRAEAHARLRAALNLLGTDLDSESEPGLSEQQETLEGLVRSVALYLGP